MNSAGRDFASRAPVRGRERDTGSLASTVGRLSWERELSEEAG
jgi:hypothetical protein